MDRNIKRYTTLPARREELHVQSALNDSSHRQVTGSLTPPTEQVRDDRASLNYSIDTPPTAAKTLNVLHKRPDLGAKCFPDAQETDQSQLSVQNSPPSQKYLMSWTIDQADVGWLGLENTPGYPSKVIIKKKMIDKRVHEIQNLRTTQCDYLVNLLEAFHHKGSIFFAYSYHGFTIDLAVACATPHIHFSEADIATVCRSTLNGLKYIHDILRTSHGDVSLENILLSEDGRVRLANIGNSMLNNNTLKDKREDIKSVGLLIIHLNEPATILEDKKLHLYNPKNVSKHARRFIEEIHTAPYEILLKHEFLHQAIPDDGTWSLIPHYFDAVWYAPVTPRPVERDKFDL